MDAEIKVPLAVDAELRFPVLGLEYVRIIIAVYRNYGFASACSTYFNFFSSNFAFSGKLVISAMTFVDGLSVCVCVVYVCVCVCVRVVYVCVCVCMFTERVYVINI